MATRLILVSDEERKAMTQAAKVVTAAGFTYLRLCRVLSSELLDSDPGSVWGHKCAKDVAAMLEAVASRESELGKGGNEDGSSTQG